MFKEIGFLPIFAASCWKKDIGHVDIHELSKSSYEGAGTVFQDCILPVLSPQIIDKHHPFPHLDNKKLYISAILKGKKS